VLKTYKYDAMNRRVAEVVGSDTTDLYYSSKWQVLEEQVNGNGKYRYVWSPVYVDAMVLRDRLDVTERLWVQQDANFNVTALVGGAGVAERAMYFASGKFAIASATWSSKSGSSYNWIRYHQGVAFDGASSLYHHRNREYSPSIGFWQSLDPISFVAGDVNLFKFVSNSPVNATDPLGYEAFGFEFDTKLDDIKTTLKDQAIGTQFSFYFPSLRT
jgi:RHS repeat-associated protein